MGRVVWLFLIAGLAVPSAAEPLAEQLETIRQTPLDPTQCYRVRDVFLEREDAKFYFTDGYLLFAKPYRDRTIAALFLATSPEDEGEILVIPPTARERRSVARFTAEPILNQKFRTAMMLFTDDTGDRLQEALTKASRASLDAARGASVVEKWTPVLKNLLGGLALRVLFDATSGWGAEEGFFAAIISGGPKGRFEVVIDPRLDQQLSVGQNVWRDGKRYYETWCRFPGRNFRNGSREINRDDSRLENYHVESHIFPDLTMQVVVRADFLPGSSPRRAFAFELSERLKVEKLLLDGKPLEFVQMSGPSSSDERRRSNDLVAFVLPAPPDADARYRIEFQYTGTVINHAGDGVYYVGSRGSWYPRRAVQFTNYELLFHHPDDLDIVATGELVESGAEAGVRFSRFRTASPIRVAGFNLGRYVRASREVGDFAVEVCANTGIENRLQPKPKVMLVPSLDQQSPRSRRRPGASSAALVTRIETRKPPSPADHIEQVATRSARAFKFFLDRFGRPTTKKVVISPIPGDFGQGFPGLVYASTLSYFEPEDAPLKNLPANQKRFYTEILPAHEISHQWWGNVLAVESMSDDWLMEALATYSALLYVEHHLGREERDEVLEEYRSRLLARNEHGEPVESAGPVVLGARLRSSQFPNAARVIVYEKGAWIMHMLRAAMGDERFFGFLRELCTKYRLQRLSTEEFREEAVRFVSPEYPDSQLRDFFEQWVYNTGIPRVQLDHSVRPKGSSFELLLQLRQEGVPEAFRVVAPVEIQTASGEPTMKMISTEGEVTELRLALKEWPLRVVLDPEGWLLLDR